MRLQSPFILAAMLGLSAVLGARKDDLVTSLPNCGEKLPTNWYSGFLEVNANKSLHYVFVESMSDKAKDDPVVIWFTGGPGCSSMVALF